MNISSIFRFTPVAKISPSTSSEISNSAKKFISTLKSVENSAKQKGYKVFGFYEKTEKYANKLEKSLQKGNLADSLKNIRKLEKHSEVLFSSTGNPFTNRAINIAREQRLMMLTSLIKEKMRSQ